MAYEVTKVVNGRPYRYRVRSERDVATGRFRNRWTYLGRADAATSPAPVRARRNARAALLDALERLLLTADPDAVTAAAVSAEAGVAHGTFYRYFRNKRDAIVALFDRVRASRSSELEALEAVPATRTQARAALRMWADALLRKPERNAGILRVLYLFSLQDEALIAHRRTRREAFVARLRAYLTTLDERGFAHVADPSATASILVAMIDGIFREAILTEALDDARIAAAVDLIDGGVFDARSSR